MARKPPIKKFYLVRYTRTEVIAGVAKIFAHSPSDAESQIALGEDFEHDENETVIREDTDPVRGSAVVAEDQSKPELPWYRQTPKKKGKKR